MAIKQPVIKLPKGVKKEDLEYMKTPRGFYTKWTDKQRDEWREMNRPIHTLQMVYTERFNWCIRSLHISNGKMSERSYAVSINDKQMCSLGNGPHILKEITVYVRRSRLNDLQYLVELMVHGQTQAHVIRDRRSTRRAQTQLRRAARSSIFG